MLEDGIVQILEKVYQKRGFDFRQYKESTLRRRTEKRIKATKSTSYQEYLTVLDADPTEYKKLLDDLTIKVTEFFRDPEAWDVLGRQVLPEIVHRPSLQIWSAGCATGEEAYSIAILLDQLLSRSAVIASLPRFTGRAKQSHGIATAAFKFTIHATDIDNDTLIKAQEAKYPLLSVKGVPKDIQDEYFDSTGGYFVIKKQIKSLVHFGLHDLVLNEPLRDMDLILCRNVVIYFERPLQEKVFMDFYNSLNEGGYLFLGKAETLIGPARERFSVVDRRWKIYQKA